MTIYENLQNMIPFVSLELLAILILPWTIYYLYQNRDTSQGVSISVEPIFFIILLLVLIYLKL